MKFTVFGASGFIGSAVVNALTMSGFEVHAPTRAELPCSNLHAGHVIYAIGLTGNFRERLFETVDAHVTLLNRLLQSVSFDSWLYLSSTRVYGGLRTKVPAQEATALSVSPHRDSVYDLSKLLGEAVCLAHPKETVRVARLSNVYGRGQSDSTFLGSLLASVRESGEVLIGEDSKSAKDYVAIDAVAPLLIRMALEGRERLYNVASGRSTTHEELAAALRQHFRVPVSFEAQAPLRRFPPIDVSRIRKEFGFVSPDVLDYVRLVAEMSRA